MITLGIESTAHTFGVGIVSSNGKVLANEVNQVRTKQGGLVPAAVSDHHFLVAPDVIRRALIKANRPKIDLVSFSQGPGLGSSLVAGAISARTLSRRWRVPLIGVNHCIAHIEIGRLMTKAKNPVFLYVSGANTQILAQYGGRYRILGETLDMGVGNFLDSLAREIGLGFPGGPFIEKEAKKSRKILDLPYVVKGMDVSFGGILTSLKQKIKSENYPCSLICSSAQETVFAMLMEVTERALAHTGKNELLLGGGVACNSRFVSMAKSMCRQRGAKLFVPDREFLVDNGAMIGWNGFVDFQAGRRTTWQGSEVRPYIRSDESF